MKLLYLIRRVVFRFTKDFFTVMLNVMDFVLKGIMDFGIWVAGEEFYKWHEEKIKEKWPGGGEG